MISGLLSGTLVGTPVAKTSKSGNPYLTAKLRIPTSGGETLWVHAVAFSTGAITALSALQEGDEISVTGPLAVKVWTGNDGVAKPDVSIIVGVVMTAYTMGKKRRAANPQTAEVAPEPAPPEQPITPRSEPAPADGDFDDDIPF